MEDHRIITLNNGIRLVYKQVFNTKIAHCGFVLNVGSRDELPYQQGIAHFWEHMAFKGTKKRKAFHILNRIDSVGGELNAYTTKEKVCFFASVLDKHFEKAIDLLKDITFDSIFPEQQIDRERNVILEEMSMYQDNPEDAIQDDLDELIFTGHPLGYNILGTKKSVQSFTHYDFKKFISQNIDTERITLSVVSNLPFKKVERVVRKYLEAVPKIQIQKARTPFDSYVAKTKILKKPITQSHCGMGSTAYNLHDEKRWPFTLVTNLLGGPGMNSRLNLGIREKYGFVYFIDASYSSFTDTGLFNIFFATDSSHLFKCVNLVLKEMRKLKEKPLTSVQLHRAKEQFIGQLAMAEENNTNLMLMMGKSLLDFNRIDTFDEAIAKVRDITQNDILEVSNEIFDENRLSFLYFKPENTNGDH